MDPIELDTLEAQVWARLTDALGDREDPWRTPVVATTDSGDAPSSRIVVLRDVDAAGWMLAFHTDVRSAKVTQLRRRSAMSWLFYDARDALQVRARGVATLHTDDALADASWASTGLASRAPYMSARPAGEPIGTPDPAIRVRDEKHSTQGRRNFCAVRCTAVELDVLQLHPSGHRRARVRPGSANWLAP